MGGLASALRDHPDLGGRPRTLMDEALRRAATHIGRVASSREREEADRLTTTLREYQQEAWHVVEPKTVHISNWHIDAITEHLEAVTIGEIRNLLINIPPRHEKSLNVRPRGLRSGKHSGSDSAVSTTEKEADHG